MTNIEDQERQIKKIDQEVRTSEDLRARFINDLENLEKAMNRVRSTVDEFPPLLPPDTTDRHWWQVWKQ